MVVRRSVHNRGAHLVELAPLTTHRNLRAWSWFKHVTAKLRSLAADKGDARDGRIKHVH